MKSAVIHGILLLVALVYGYRTWTRDKTVKPDMGTVVLWKHAAADLVSIEYKTDTKIVSLAKKTSGSETYWWGSEVTITKPPKPASAGSGSAGAGSAAEAKETRKTREFPVGDAADKLVTAWADAHALRDLGKLDDKKQADYKLAEPKGTVTVTFKDGARSFKIGDTVYSTADRYALDPQSGDAYVLSRDLLSSLESGEPILHLTDPRGFEASKIDQVTIEAGTRTKKFARVMTSGEEGKQVKTWGDPDTKQGNQVAANFIDNTNNLRPTEYLSDVKPSDGTLLVKLAYRDDRGNVLGTLALYRYVKPGELPPGQELQGMDPASLPKGETEYFVMTEKTHIPGLVRKDTAERAEQDIDAVFSNNPPPAAGSGAGSGVHSITPHGNPFGNGPLPPTTPSHGPLPPTTPSHGPRPPTTPSHAGSAAGSAAHPQTVPTPAPKSAGAGSAAPPHK